MTVAELITELQKHDPSRLVVMSKDAEGNDICPLLMLHDCYYHPETGDGFGRYATATRNPKGAVAAVCLWAD